MNSHKPRRFRRILIWTLLLLLVASAGLVAWYWTLGPGELTPWLIRLGWAEDPNAPLKVSGLLEATAVTLSAELSGHVVDIHVSEGDPVRAGDLLLVLDSTLFEAQLAEAEAGIAVAQATLAKAAGGARAEQIQEAEALLAQATAARDGAYQALLDVQAIRADPQELDDQIDQVRAQVEVANHLVMQAVGIKDAVEIVRNNVDWGMSVINDLLTLDVPLPIGDAYPIRLGRINGQSVKTAVEYQWWYAWTLVNTAGAGRDGAQNVLNELERVRQNPLELNARVAEARSHYESALAMVQAAQANLDGLEAGATEAQLDVIRARVKEAEAAKGLAQMQVDKSLVYAPIGGTVIDIPLYVGEAAQPGSRLMVIADLDRINLTVYVPENRLDKVWLGQHVSVTVDAFPQRTFEGTVARIASEAEYTPQAVQSKEERVNMVFAVRIELSNDEHLLKAGMPADALFATR